MKKTLFLGTALALFAGTVAFADAFTDQIVADLESKGYDRIEIKVGPTQTKAEAINGNNKIEVVYDNSTGKIVKQEMESADGENIDVGVEIRTENNDFVDGGNGGSDDHGVDDDHESGSEDGPDDDSSDDSNDDHGNNGKDDHGGDDGEDDHGGDDGEDDHDGDDHGGDDDDSDDDENDD